MPAQPATGPILLRQLLATGNRLSDLPWQPFRPGIEIMPLYAAKEGRSSAALLKYSAGAKVPKHTHSGYEHIFVLFGSQSDEQSTCGVGDLLISPPGTSHSIASEAGCIVYAVWERQVIFDE